MRHPRHELDDLLGHPVRFSMMALLAAAHRVEFSFVRDHVEVTDSTLSKQMSALEQAGYIKVNKGFVGKRPRTWLSLTKEGRRVFQRHMTALRDIARGNGAGLEHAYVNNQPPGLPTTWGAPSASEGRRR